MKKRIIIEISKLTDTNWSLIYRFIRMCHGKGDFEQSDFFELEKHALIRYHTVTKPEDAQFAYNSPLSVDIIHDEIIRKTEFSISIIYKKADTSADYCLLMPFLLWIEQADMNKVFNLSLGIDISIFNDKKAKENYIFKFGQLLKFISLPKPDEDVGYRCLYYIDWKDENRGYKICADFPKENLRNKSKRFLAILKIEPSLLSIFKNIRKDNEKIEKTEILNETKKWIGESIRILDEGLSEQLNKHLCVGSFNSIFEEWFIKAYFYSCKYDKEEKDKNEIFSTAEIESMKSILHSYCNNIYELVQNIVFHSDKKKGLLFLLFNKKSNVSPALYDKIPNIDTYSDSDRFVEIGIYDYGKTGIVEKFGRNELTLKSFFDPNEVLPDDNDYDYLSLRYAAHLGIKSFVSSVMNHNGYFCAESNNAKGKKDKIESHGRSLGDPYVIDNYKGTHYKILLPVTKNEYPYLFEPLQAYPIVESLKKQLEVPYIEIIKHDKIVAALKADVQNKASQIEMIKQIGFEIVEHVACDFESSTCHSIAIDMKGNDNMSPNILFKLLAYLQLSKKHFEKIVLTNLKPQIIIELCDKIHDLSNNSISKDQPIWSNEHAVVLIDNHCKPFVFCGETKADFYYVNKYMNLYYYDINNEFENFKNDSNKDSYETNILNKFVLPYDCIVGPPSQSCFVNYLNDVLENPIEEDTLGCKVDVPTRIGNKLYIDHFYEADFLFQNVFFADRFAYFIAKTIVSKLNNTNKLLLIGYNSYSELLVERVKSFVNSKYNKKVVFTNIAVVDESTNGISFVNNNLDHIILDDYEQCDVITIVPIASTLTTFEKIIIGFLQRIGEKRTRFNFLYNYCSILVRDNYEEKETMGGITTQERDRKWKSINNNTVTTCLPNAQIVHFLIAKPCGWNNLIDENTFPKTEYWKETYINQTRNSALNIKDYLKYPVASIPPNYSNNGKIKDYYEHTKVRLEEMADYIYFGHLIHNDDHHRYYFDIKSYIKDFEDREDKKKTQLYKWINGYLKNKKIEINSKTIDAFDNSHFNIIVTSDPGSDPYLINFINKYLFRDNAYVLFLDLSDYSQNIISKQSFIKNLDKNSNNSIRYHFVDQALFTGGSYQKAKSFMSMILSRPDFKFYSVLTIINRLSKDKYDEITNDLHVIPKNDSNIYSYCHFFVLPSKSQDTECGLCNLEEYFDKLKDHSVIKDCRSVIEANKHKYQKSLCSICISDVQKSHCVSKKERYVKRMEWRDRLFYKISKICGYDHANLKIEDQQKIVENELNRLYEQCVDIDDKIPFLKAISYPPLSEYVKIRKYAFCLMLKELRTLLREDQEDGKKFQIYDLFLLKVLLKHLAMLGSNALVRRDVILGSWKVFCSVKEQLPDEIIQIRQSIKQVESEISQLERLTKQTVDEILQLEQSIKQIRQELEKQLSLFNNESDGLSEGKLREKAKKELLEKESQRKELKEKLKKNSHEKESKEKLKKKLTDKIGYINEYIDLDDSMIDKETIIERVNKEDNKLNEFVSDLHFYIKLAAHKDEAKSFWLGELLRRGREINAKSFNLNSKAHKTKLFNHLWYHNSESDFNTKLLPYLFYDNTTIIRKTLDNFEKELKKDPELERRFYDDNGTKLIDFKTNQSQEFLDAIIERFKAKTQEEYYYSWFRFFLAETGGKIVKDISIDNLPMIKKHAQVLYARLLLRELKNPNHPNDESFDKNAESLLEVFAKIMDAQAAFIAIKPRQNEQIYTLASYQLKLKEEINYEAFYCKELLYESISTEKGRPFVMRNSIAKKGESFRKYDSNSFNRAAFLTLNLVDEKGNKEVDSLVGMVTFLYRDGGNIIQNKVLDKRFMIEKQELGRLLLLLKPETDAYVKHIADEKQFEVWKERYETKKMLQKINYKSGHRFLMDNSDFSSLNEEECSKIYKEFFTMSNIVMSYIFSLIYNGTELSFSSNSYKLSEIFNNRFRGLLRNLNYEKWNNKFNEEINIESDITINVNLFVFQSFIVQCINNCKKHSPGSQIDLLFYNNRMEIVNSLNENHMKAILEKKEKFDARYSVEKLNENIKSLSLEGYGLTLVSLFMYCESVRMKCIPEFNLDNKPCFKVAIYYFNN